MALWYNSWSNPYAMVRPPVRGAKTGGKTGSGGAGGKSGDLFDADGLPTRLPTSPEEALQFQFAAANWARRKNQSMLDNAQATMRYGLGMINKFGPYSAATMMNPLLGQMSQNYMNMQYDQPDYSYFMRKGTPGSVTGGGGGGYFSGQASARADWPVQMQFPGEVPPRAPTPAAALGGLKTPDEDPVIDFVGGNDDSDWGADIKKAVENPADVDYWGRE
jgi:hypothetical protein